MARPPFATGLIQSAVVQETAGEGLEVVQDPFGTNLGLDNQMNVISADMGRP